jgi:hypothetical protein
VVADGALHDLGDAEVGDDCAHAHARERERGSERASERAREGGRAGGRDGRRASATTARERVWGGNAGREGE